MGSSKYGGNRGGGTGRLPYGIMLILAFGAAVFGVMVLQKFRERRIFNILIKDKDTHIITLQLLLQKEKDYTKEMKKKIEEMKAKAFSLRTQKVELNNKIMDMQSLIGSLKEEGKALESELEEKRNEIKMLRDKEIDSSNDSSQVASLTELLKQKEDNIEDMKRRLENAVHVWSVSTDDPSKPVDNSTANVVEKSIEAGEKALNAKDGVILAGISEGGFGNATEGAAQTEVQEVKLQNIENKQDGEGLRNATEGAAQTEVQEVKLLDIENKQDGEGLRNATEGAAQAEGQEGKLQNIQDKQDGEGLRTAEDIQEREQVWVDTKQKPDDSNNAQDFRMSGEKGNKNETEVVESSREDELLKTKVEDANTKSLGNEINMEADGSQNAVRTGAISHNGNRLRSKAMKKRWRKISRNRDQLEKTGSFNKGEGGLENNGSGEDQKNGLGDFAGKRAGEVLRNRRLELPKNPESLRTGAWSDDQVGLEANEDTMVSSSDGHLEQNQQTKNFSHESQSENGDGSGIEETTFTDSNQARVSSDGHDDDSETNETNATDSNQQKKPIESEDQQ